MYDCDHNHTNFFLKIKDLLFWEAKKCNFWPLIFGKIKYFVSIHEFKDVLS